MGQTGAWRDDLPKSCFIAIVTELISNTYGSTNASQSLTGASAPEPSCPQGVQSRKVFTLRGSSSSAPYVPRVWLLPWSHGYRHEGKGHKAHRPHQGNQGTRSRKLLRRQVGPNVISPHASDSEAFCVQKMVVLVVAYLWQTGTFREVLFFKHSLSGI
ncbi:MAG: hypothetical protein RLZZ234_849 [Candidatus Parcubacteria bacterium]